jgi:uncharacterized protein
MHIQQNGNIDNGSFFILENDQLLAKITFMARGDNLISIDHTFVSESLKGKGVGKKLVMEVVALARQHQLKILPLCSFAHAIMNKEDGLQDVLVQE